MLKKNPLKGSAEGLLAPSVTKYPCHVQTYMQATHKTNQNIIYIICTVASRSGEVAPLVGCFPDIRDNPGSVPSATQSRVWWCTCILITREGEEGGSTVQSS